jgi:hypothetical protein
MAVRFRDGWGVYVWHGITVPSWVIEHPEQISTDKINGEKNAEVRRVMIERYGFERYMLDAGASILDELGEYKLISVPDPAERQMVALKMVCPTTGAVYIHAVAPHLRTVNEALAWKREEEYQDHKFARHGDVYLIDLNKKGNGTDYFDNLIWEA